MNIVLCRDICKAIGLKRNMMLDTTKLQFDSNENDVDVHSRNSGILLKSCMEELKCSCWLLCKGDDCEEVLYGEC